MECEVVPVRWGRAPPCASGPEGIESGEKRGIDVGIRYKVPGNFVVLFSFFLLCPFAVVGMHGFEL
jgi:hypothetical protein